MNGRALKTDEATLAQVRAADPDASTWVSANAGSGKTRVLTDRVARLLFQETPPEKILCLTYTKAAAAEMQNRLFERLGAWAMMPDAKLEHTLLKLGVEGPLHADALRGARRLFARALETPGGLKIQTIHSFCDKLLRRFPMEAGVSPQFHVLDDRQGNQLRTEILQGIAGGTDARILADLALYFSGADFDTLLKEISGMRNEIAAMVPVTDAALAALPTDQQLADFVMQDYARDVMEAAATELDVAGESAQEVTKLKALLALNDPTAFLQKAEAVFLVGSGASQGEPRVDKISNKKMRLAFPDIFAKMNDIALRVHEAKPQRIAALAARKSAALQRFSAVYLAQYDAQKSAAGWLDYDDQIDKALALLSDSASAQWVLYRLDGGIDHILVDEAQDTSPKQWKIVSRLADEFTAGLGAERGGRTIFVVGDEKQSIYSFQGADPAEFAVMQAHFSERLAAAESRLESQNLLYSFRSADPILRLVDKIFVDGGGAGVATHTQHLPFFDTLPGRVDLWPFLEKEPKGEPAPWYKPVDEPSPSDPRGVLAHQLATWVKTTLDKRTLLPGTNPRPIMAGDILFLVQRRGVLFESLIKELKALDLPVAGADRLKVGRELAVRDVLALLKFTDLAEDDLSLAEALRSPLLGLSEGQLFDVAHGRKRSLWEALRGREAEFPEQLAMLHDTLRNADYLRPFELIERILGHHGGRENLLARLGQEAEDGLNALLDQAMQYEQLEAPSLSGFLNWFDAGEVEIKREIDKGSDQIRVMTVHGAKGLEAPIVILPDTAQRKHQDRGYLLSDEAASAVWKSPKEDATEVQIEAQNTRKAFELAERQRLLYVALTRAEQWLVVAGAGEKSGSWYETIEAAMADAADPVEIEGVGQGMAMTHLWDPSFGAGAEPTVQTTKPALPDWALTAAPVVVKPLKPISPSKLPGAKVLAGDGQGLSEADAMRRGRQIHLLLEHFPSHPNAAWQAVAERLLVGEFRVETDGELDGLIAEVSGVLSNPEVEFLFQENALAEVGITAQIAELENGRIDGIIDRVIVEKDRIIAVDFKSNAIVPRRSEDIPDGILRQLGAYLVALEQIYTDLPVEVGILWTANQSYMTVPHDIVMDALQSTPTS